MAFCIDEKDIAGKVEMELKKGGTFDRIRKEAFENLRESETVKAIEKEMLNKVDEIMNRAPKASKDELQRKVRESFAENHNSRNNINRLVRSELDEPWVREKLRPEIIEKVQNHLEPFRKAA